MLRLHEIISSHNLALFKTEKVLDAQKRIMREFYATVDDFVPN